jgi:hypothetical protein
MSIMFSDTEAVFHLATEDRSEPNLLIVIAGEVFYDRVVNSSAVELLSIVLLYLLLYFRKILYDGILLSLLTKCDLTSQSILHAT